jgi:hypothetical protein
MKKLLIILFCFISLSLAGQHNTYYVATTGSDAAAGTIGAPWGSWQKAFETAEAGDTVYFRGGIWYPTSHTYSNDVTCIKPAVTPHHGHTGTATHHITYRAYPGETPILDCSLIDLTGKSYNNGLAMDNVEFIDFTGLTIRNVWQRGQHIQAFGIYGYAVANMTFTRVNVYNTAGNAIRYFGWIGTDVGEYGFTRDTTIFYQCDAYNNFDTINIGDVPGNAGDGWKTNSNYDPAYGGCYYVFDQCRAWNNSDDGFDPSGSGVTIIKNCWSFKNGVTYLGVESEGNGFKSGGVYGTDDLSYPTRYGYRNIAAFNLGDGWYDLEYPSYRRNNSRIFNNTFYHNNIGIQISSNATYPDSRSIYTNNIVYGTVATDAGSRPYNLDVGCLYYEASNTWDYGEIGSLPHWIPTDTVTVTDADFLSVDETDAIAEMTSARQADGSLPTITFLRLVAASDLVDAGKVVYDENGDALTYTGAAPDIGWSEYSSAQLTGTDITTFTLAAQTGSATINTTLHTVAIEVIYGTDITDIAPTITLSIGATINPTSGTERNFTNPVTYTVTAQDAVTTQEWIITVTVAVGIDVPTLTTIIPTYNAIRAFSSGNVINDNNSTVTARGICWSTSASPTIADNIVPSGTGEGTFSVTIYGLTSNTTYHVRAYATNGGGTAYGDDVSFTTPVSSVGLSGTKIGVVNGKVGIVK